MANLIALAKSHLEAMSKQDWKAYRNALTDDAVYEEESTQRRVQGADQYVRVIQEWSKAFPDVRATIKDSFATQDAAILELEWEGTHRGQLAGPFGVIPPTGRQGKVPAMIVFRFDGEKIRETRHYFDLLRLLDNLGVIPRPQPPAASK